MAHTLPVEKLAGLLVKTLAKPLSKTIKHEFSRHEFTKGILVGIGQTSHNITSRMTIWSAGYKVRSITPLEDEKALKEGADFVGEFFVLLVSGGILVREYNRSKDKERQKEEKIQEIARAERQALQAKLHTLDVRLKALEVVVKKQSNSLLNLTGGRYVEPSPQELISIDEDDEKLKQQFLAKEKASATPPPQDSKMRCAKQQNTTAADPVASAMQNEIQQKEEQADQVDQSSNTTQQTANKSFWRWPPWPFS